ncbi:MAG TPA: AAA family ATPase, partial [Acidimicrobiales bacterium]|nr:AAA family ATPase [Acidimicrobiales bacterium]
REVVSAVAGTRPLVLAVGPAGTGKTTALAPAAAQLRAEGRAVFGVAPSATAAEVLATDTGVDADTLDKLLVEHRLQRPPDHRFDLPAGATVLVDEAAMVPTSRLGELAELADQRGWRVALIGDPLQFSAVGRGGMFAHLVEVCGAIELDRVRRFAHDWERDASLRLRRGDTGVVELYDDHGRLHVGNRGRMEAMVVRAWWAARARGESAAMMAPTNEAVVSLNHRAQQLRTRAGVIDPDSASVVAGSYSVHVGDRVATRRNERRLRTDRGLMVKNRDHWDVIAVHPAGDLTVAGSTGEVRLPSDYAKHHVELAYAQTSHATQGRTVDRSFLLLDGPTDTRGVYVPMTRGRLSNEAFVVLDGEQSATDVISEALSRKWIDQPALSRRAELQHSASQPAGARSMQRPLDSATLRLLMERDYELAHGHSRAQAQVDILRHQLTRNQERRRQLSRSLEADRVRLEQARRTVEALDRPMRRRRHRVEMDAAQRQLRHLPASIERDGLELADLEANAVVDRQRLIVAEEALGRRGDVMEERLSIACRLEFDVKARAAVLGEDPPAYLAERLGPRPPFGATANLWDQAAGHIDQHRTAFDVDCQSLLGHQPHRDDHACARSHQAAMKAIERLDRALGREMGIEPPSRGLGLSR